MTRTPDQPALDRLDETVALQRKAYLKQPYPPQEARVAPIMSPHGDVTRQFIRTNAGGPLGD